MPMSGGTTVTFTNDFPAVGPTGVSFSNLPFTLMPAVGLAMPLLIPHKRRRREED